MAPVLSRQEEAEGHERLGAPSQSGAGLKQPQSDLSRSFYQMDGRLKLEAEINWAPLFRAGQYYTSEEAHHARAVINRRTVIPVEDFELPQSFTGAEVIP